jgi:hypothetical protein
MGMNLKEAADLLRCYITADIPTMLWGAPGIGKSQVVRQLAAERGVPCLDFRLMLREAVDLRGLPAADLAKGETRWLRPSDLPFEGSDHPGDCILFMDEINTAPPSLQPVAFGLVEERRVGEHVLKPGVRIVAAGNRKEDKASAQRMPTPLLSRFAHIDVLPDVKTFVAHAAGAGFAPEVIACIQWAPELLHNMTPPPGEELRTFPTPRGWEKVSRLQPASMPENIVGRAVAGIVGDVASATFTGFLRIWKNLPPLPQIIADPAGAPVPTDPGILYALSSALARAATRANFDSVMRYGERLEPDYFTTLVIQAVRRNPDLQTTKAYVDWSVRYQGVAG